jgi:hypothetical protein
MPIRSCRAQPRAPQVVDDRWHLGGGVVDELKEVGFGRVELLIPALVVKDHVEVGPPAFAVTDRIQAHREETRLSERGAVILDTLLGPEKPW